jgi:hypothetical protein
MNVAECSHQLSGYASTLQDFFGRKGHPGKKKGMGGRAAALPPISFFLDLGPLAAHREKTKIPKPC